MTSKNLKSAYEKIDRSKKYPLAEAVKLMIETSTVKFDPTAEVHFTLGIDPRHADQQIRSTLSLPHGTGKKVRVVVFCDDDQTKSALAAGAIEAGGEDLIRRVIEKSWTDFDIAVATPNFMKLLAKAARILGPKGLMPNPKAGTVTSDVEKTVRELIAGRIEIRNDKAGIVHAIFGKLSFGAEKLLENLETVVATIKDHKPATQKGEYLKNVTINATMGAGVRIEV